MIDAHHHLWKYSAAEYGWITPQMRVLRRDFLPAQLEDLMHHFGIEGTVAVQARQTVEETSWLLSLAAKHPLIRGVVGWVPLTEGAGVKRHLEHFAGNQSLRGVRHVIHDEPDPRYILRDDFNAGISALQGTGLRYDILIFERHLPAPSNSSIAIPTRFSSWIISPSPASRNGFFPRGTATCANLPSVRTCIASFPAW